MASGERSSDGTGETCKSRSVRRIVTQPGSAEGCRIPMLHKARMKTAEIGQCLGLYTLSLHTVRRAPELIPLLAYNATTQQVTAVHRNILELPAAPDTHLLQHIVNTKQEHGRRIEGRSNVDDGAVTRSGHYGGDSDVTSII